MESYCTALDAPPSPPPGAKRPLQWPHFQPLATVQNDPSRTPFTSTTCHSPPRGEGGPPKRWVPHNLAELRNPPFRSSTCA
jgi:hypothetical protein